MFTCATDTGELIWAVGDSKAFFNNISMPMDDLFPTFHLKLISQNGRIFISTATIDNVDLDHNGTAISCSDSAFPQYTTAVETVVVPGIYLVTDMYYYTGEITNYCRIKMFYLQGLLLLLSNCPSLLTSLLSLSAG